MTSFRRPTVHTRSRLLPHRTFRKSPLQLPDDRPLEFRSTASRATSPSPTCRPSWLTRNITALVTLPHRTTLLTLPPIRRLRPLHAPPPNRPPPPESFFPISKRELIIQAPSSLPPPRPHFHYYSFVSHFLWIFDMHHELFINQ